MAEDVSNMTIASSITIPTATSKPRSVIVSIVNPAIFIKINEPIMEIGIAKNEINVERKEPIKKNTIIPAKIPPRTKCSNTL